MGAEARGKGVNILLGPMMNIGRVAAGGRNWEGKIDQVTVPAMYIKK